MTLQDYYHIIKIKIESLDFKIKKKSKDFFITKEECSKNSHLEAIHYLMFEYMLDRKDKRFREIFDYVCIPKKVNEGELDIDFTKYDVEKFLKEIMILKD